MRLKNHLLPRSAPSEGAGAAICPHCWMVNPGPFILCARCGADMRTHLQESGGLRWTAPVQSPVPVGVAATLSIPVRAVLAAFLVLLALGQVLAATGRRPVAGTPVSNPAPSPTPAAAF